MLYLQDISFSYPKFYLNMNVKIPNNTRIAIVGPSGSGKSTLLSLIAGFKKLKSGSLYFHDDNITKTPVNKRPVSYIFQEHNLFEHLTVQKNVGLAIHQNLKFSDNQKKQIYDALLKVGLADHEHSYPHNLSGGQRKRVALARCTLQNKPILLLDEAFQSVGPAQRQQLMDLVCKIQTQCHYTLLFVTHNIDVMMHLGTHILFIDSGQILFFGTVSEFFSEKIFPKFEYYTGKIY